MSEVLKNCPDNGNALSHYVVADSKTYYVDSRDTCDCGLETMVFPCSSNCSKVDFKKELYVKHYDGFSEMRKHHYELINNLEKYILK